MGFRAAKRAALFAHVVKAKKSAKVAMAFAAKAKMAAKVAAYHKVAAARG